MPATPASSAATSVSPDCHESSGGPRSSCRRSGGGSATPRSRRRPPWLRRCALIVVLISRFLPGSCLHAHLPGRWHPAHQPAQVQPLLRHRRSDPDTRFRRHERPAGTRGGRVVRRPAPRRYAAGGSGACAPDLCRPQPRSAALHLARAASPARPPPTGPALGVLADVGLLPAASAERRLARPTTRPSDGVHGDQSRDAPGRPPRRVEERHPGRAGGHRRSAARLAPPATRRAW